MHPQLETFLHRYHQGAAVFTVIRQDGGATGWMLSRDDMLLAWDGWYSTGQDPELDALPGLVDAIGEEWDMDDVRGANRTALSVCLRHMALLADGDLAPEWLADRINDDGPEPWGRRMSLKERGDLLSAEPLAFLVVGRPDGLRELADALE